MFDYVLRLLAITWFIKWELIVHAIVACLVLSSVDVHNWSWSCLWIPSIVFEVLMSEDLSLQDLDYPSFWDITSSGYSKLVFHDSFSWYVFLLIWVGQLFFINAPCFSIKDYLAAVVVVVLLFVCFFVFLYWKGSGIVPFMIYWYDSNSAYSHWKDWDSCIRLFSLFFEWYKNFVSYGLKDWKLVIPTTEFRLCMSECFVGTYEGGYEELLRDLYGYVRGNNIDILTLIFALTECSITPLSIWIA